MSSSLFSMKTYQKFTVTPENKLVLSDHTLQKSFLVEKGTWILLDTSSPTGEKQQQQQQQQPEKGNANRIKVLDVGSAEGILSFCLMDMFPTTSFDLVQVNPTTKETSIAQNIFETVYSSGESGKNTLTILPKFFNEIEVKPYDLVMFFAIFHHILHTYKNQDEAIDHIARFVNKVAIIEVPLAGDALLDIWKAKNPGTDYSCLANRENFEKLLGKHFHVVHSERIDYDAQSGKSASGAAASSSSDLCRWGFVILKKKQEPPVDDAVEGGKNKSFF